MLKGALEPLLLIVKGNVIGPHFHADVSAIDFGQISYGFLRTMHFNLINTCSISLNFSLRIPYMEENSSCGQCQFELNPTCGTIEPFGSRSIKLDFKPSYITEYNTMVAIDIDAVGENIYTIPLKANSMVAEVRK